MLFEIATFVINGAGEATCNSDDSQLQKERPELECPANFVPVEMRQAGMRGAWNGTREEAYTGADRNAASSG
jgi:hypothetical protein